MKAKIKIMQIITQLQRGGAELLLLNVCSGLIQKDKDIEIKVVSLLNKLSLAPEFEKYGIKVICLNTEHYRFPQKIYSICKAINKYKPDIVHSHLPNADRYALIAAFLGGVKNRICTAHNMEPQISRQEKISRFVTSIFAKKIIAVSNSAREFYIKNKSYPEDKIKVIPNCPGFYPGNNRPRSLPKKPESIKLVNIGKFKIQKGQIYLLRAMKELQDSPYNFFLEIYGRGSNNYELLLYNEVSRLKLKNVFFKGVTNNVKDVLNHADLLIASSLWEGFHIVITEAMSMGIPIVATNIPPHLELLEGVNEKVFVDPQNPKAIADAVEMLVEDPSLYNIVSRQVLKCAEHYSVLKAIDRYNNFYKSLFN